MYSENHNKWNDIYPLESSKTAKKLPGVITKPLRVHK